MSENIEICGCGGQMTTGGFAHALDCPNNPNRWFITGQGEEMKTETIESLRSDLARVRGERDEAHKRIGELQMMYALAPAPQQLSAANQQIQSLTRRAEEGEKS